MLLYLSQRSLQLLTVDNFGESDFPARNGSILSMFIMHSPRCLLLHVGHNGKDDPEDLPPPRAAGDQTYPWLDATPRPKPLPPVNFFPFFLLD